jgi:hypothetical protein
MKISLRHSAFIQDRQSPLLGEDQSGFCQLIAQTRFINAFHQSWTGVAMHLNRTTGDPARELTIWNWHLGGSLRYTDDIVAELTTGEFPDDTEAGRYFFCQAIAARYFLL